MRGTIGSPMDGGLICILPNWTLVPSNPLPPRIGMRRGRTTSQLAPIQQRLNKSPAMPSQGQKGSTEPTTQTNPHPMVSLRYATCAYEIPEETRNHDVDAARIAGGTAEPRWRDASGNVLRALELRSCERGPMQLGGVARLPGRQGWRRPSPCAGVLPVICSMLRSKKARPIAVGKRDMRIPPHKWASTHRLIQRNF